MRGEPFFRMKEVAGRAKLRTSHQPHQQSWDAITLYQLIPTTGRKHQLRLHLAALGIPVINDKLYPAMTYFS